jgi:transposase
MLQITPHMRILVCMQPVDFRKGIDGIAAVCRNHIGEDPHSGTLFLFRNRSKCTIRILTYDGQGFWLCSKRLSKGKFHWWPENGSTSACIQSWDLQTLLGNGDPSMAAFAKDWRKIEKPSEINSEA